VVLVGVHIVRRGFDAVLNPPKILDIAKYRCATLRAYNGVFRIPLPFDGHFEVLKEGCTRLHPPLLSANAPKAPVQNKAHRGSGEKRDRRSSMHP
jgi:hypothetical protein